MDMTSANEIDTDLKRLTPIVVLPICRWFWPDFAIPNDSRLQMRSGRRGALLSASTRTDTWPAWIGEIGR